MKTLILAALLSATFAAPRPAATPADFSGAWTLDKAQSTGLPPFYASIRSHRLAITQSATELKVHVEVDAGGSAPELFDLVYPLDGGESATTSRVRTPNGPLDVPTRLKGVPGDDGRLHLTLTRELRMGERMVTTVGTEVLELRADGALVIHRVDQMPQGGEIRAEMVFVRG